MNEQQRQKLQTILSAADEGFLVALANKGLVRRAEKDLQGATVTIEETDTELIVRCGDWTVWMPADGPTKARDDTKSTGVTRQILTATMYLKEHWSATGSSAPPQTEATSNGVEPGVEAVSSDTPVLPEESAASTHANVATGSFQREALLEIKSETLVKWAGKLLFEEMKLFVEQAPAVEFEQGVTLVIRFTQHDVEVRALPITDKGLSLLNQLLTTAPKSLQKRWVTAAVLAIKKANNVDIEAPESMTSSSSKKHMVESPRSRSEILQDVRDTLASMLKTGIAHPSNRIVERLSTLSMSATAVLLPRLGLMLRTLAEEVSLALERDAGSDAHRTFSLMANIYAVAKALMVATDSEQKYLEGVARTQYDPIGSLSLNGVGAFSWETSSGYEGVTSLFWDASQERFLTWSASRPLGTRGFSIENTYRLEPPWTESQSVEKACRSSFVLARARVNAVGRISASKDTLYAGLEEKYLPDQIDFKSKQFSDWHTLADYASKQLPVGLRVPNPLDRIVVVQPEKWGQRFFDEMQQAFCWQLLDQQGRTVTLNLPWNKSNEKSIEFLESFKPERERTKRIVARIAFSTRGFVLEPLSLISSGNPLGACILNPCFDFKLIESKQSGLLNKLREKFKRNIIQTTMVTDDEWEEEFQISAIDSKIPSIIRNCLSETESVLLQVAESGSSSYVSRYQDRLSELARQAARVGLSELQDSLNFSEAPETLSESLLWSYYTCRLHWQLLTSLSVREAG